MEGRREEGETETEGGRGERERKDFSGGENMEINVEKKLHTQLKNHRYSEKYYPLFKRKKKIRLHF